MDPARVAILVISGIGGAAAGALDLTLLLDKELLAAALLADLRALVGLREALDAFPHMG
jgi:hypothetical protein